MVIETKTLFVPLTLFCSEEFGLIKLNFCSVWLISGKEKQDPAIFLAWNEKIGQTCSDIKVNDLNSENGVDILIKKLISFFSKDTNQAAYLVYEKFETLQLHSNPKPHSS